MLLPGDLLDDDPGPLRPLISWAGGRLSGAARVVVDAAEFAPYWSSADRSGRMSRDEAGTLAQVLERIGVGLEPDVRFGGPPLRPGPVVLFPLDPNGGGTTTTAVGSQVRRSQDFRVACHLLAVAAATVLRTAGLDETARCPVDRAMTALAAEFTLTVRERARLAARLEWLLASGTTAARIRRDTARLTEAERSVGGHFLVRLVTDAPTVAPQDIAGLADGFRLLSLSLDDLHHRLHVALSTSPDAGSPAPGHRCEPVVVRSARPASSGHALPWAAASTDGTTVRLRPAVIDRQLDETQAVTALLAEIFSADAEVTAETVSAANTTPPGDDQPPVLDAPHRGLLADIAVRPRWTTAEFTVLAAHHGVLPAGALDIINDAAIHVSGSPAIEEDDGLLEIDDIVVQEVLR